MKNKNKNQKRSRSLRKQMVTTLLLVFLLAMVVNGIMIYQVQMGEYLEKAKTAASQAMMNLEMELNNYVSQTWLVDYWYRHPEEVASVEADYESESEAYYTERRRLEDQFGKNLENMTDYDVMNLSEKDKMTFAALCYAKMKDKFFYSYWENNVTDIYAIYVSKNGEDSYRTTYLFDARAAYLDKMTGEAEEVAPGGFYDWKGKEYPTLQALYEGKQVDDWMDIRKSDTKFSNIYLRYDPNWRFEKLNIVFVVEFDDTIVRQGMIGRILKVELLSALILFMSISLLYLLFRRNIEKPIQVLQRSVRFFAKEKDSDKTLEMLRTLPDIREINVLKKDFSELVVEVIRYGEEIQKMTSEKERIDTELNLAAAIQTSVLPHDFQEFSEEKRFSVFASMTPAKEVGGDFYDFCKIDEDHVMLSIGDVSGKGVPAALFMMVTKELIGQHALLDLDPAEILKNVNNHISKNNDQCLFVTVWLGIYEISSGTLIAANAGHESPAISRAGGAYQFYDDEHGLCLGLMGGEEYTNYTLRLEKGDTLFVYTDGVIEAIDEKEDLFNEERMLASLTKRKEKNLPDLLDGVRKDIQIFQGKAVQFDDITMLAIRVEN